MACAEGIALSAIAPPFRVDVRPQRERVVVVPVGEMDLSTVDVVQAELDGVRAAGWKTVVLDLREVSFIDSTGLSLILGAHRVSAEHGLDFAIIEYVGPVRRLLDISGVSHVSRRAERNF